ncbi:MAG: hydroxyethylthiazole kinase [Alistipes sp.]|nr:hydroxyethylthiazole kinase [Candidatus Alistipes equi]
MITLDTFEQELKRVRNKAPLVVCITNHVVTNFTADALLAIGAKPFMSESSEEIEEVSLKADALLINIGTLTQEQKKLISLAIAAAQKHNIPWVLDPVGAGFTSYRRQFCRELIESGCPSLIKGNPSEIDALCLGELTSIGTDSTICTTSVKKQAEILAQKKGCIVALSGKKDIITNGWKSVEILNGTPELTNISGSGCILGAIAAAFLVGSSQPLSSVEAAFLLENIAGELAQRNFHGYGSFKMALLDELSHPSAKDYFNRIKQ